MGGNSIAHAVNLCKLRCEKYLFQTNSFLSFTLLTGTV